MLVISIYINTICGKVNIIPKDQAEANPVGDGRSDPNHSPYLPPPTGRLVWSLNPFSMINQCVGPEVRNKIYLTCCVILCLAICIALGPMILGDVIAELINPMNW
jgi:hypothetical protein